MRVWLITLVTLLSLESAAGSEKTPSGAQKGEERTAVVPSVALADYGKLLAYTARRLRGERAPRADLPESVLQDTVERSVFISASDGRNPARVARGSGPGLVAAVDAAIARAGELTPRVDPRWIKLDIVRDVGAIEVVRPGAPLRGGRGPRGIILEAPLNGALLAEELVAGDLLSSKGTLRPENVAGYLRRRAPGKDPAAKWKTVDWKVRRFSTDAYFYDGKTTSRLFHGRTPRYRFRPATLLDAARAAGRYLVRATGQKGKFKYSYLCASDEVARKYNLVRHAGTIYSMLELFEVTGDKDLLAASERAIAYLRRRVEPWGSGTREAAVLVEKGKIKLGGVALALLALAEHAHVTGALTHLPLMHGFARYIRSVQQPDGSFISQVFYPSGQPSDWTSEYYPGEAIFALARLHGLDRDADWLDVAEKGAEYLILERDKGLDDAALLHDHWLLYALNEIYGHHARPLFLERAMRIARAITAAQNRRPTAPEHLGSFYHPPRSTPTATRTEGLLAAYQLARKAGRTADAKEFLKSAVLAVGFQLGTQFLPESVLYLPSPQRSLGGFSRSLTQYEVRIDYVQHNLSSLLALYKVMRSESRLVLGREFTW